MAIHLKGSAVSATLKYLRLRGADEAYPQILEQLPVGDRERLSRVLASQWIPVETVMRLLETAARVLGEDPQELAFQAGGFAAEDGLTTLYKIFFRFGSPEFILARASRVWSTYWDSGQMSVVVSEPGHLEVRVAEFPVGSELVCQRTRGWIHRAFELMGFAPQVSHPACVLRGDPYCQHRVDWEPQRLRRASTAPAA
jgi:hypothetical protein